MEHLLYSVDSQNILQLNLDDVEDIVNKFKDKIEYNYQNGKRISNKYSKFYLMKQQEQKVDYILEKIINEFALLRNQWLGITKGLDQKQWQITNIVKLRVAGMEDADIK